MRGAIPPLPQYAFMAWCLVKHRGNFTFSFNRVYRTNQHSVQELQAEIKAQMTNSGFVYGESTR
jgi:hypothetical protein